MFTKNRFAMIHRYSLLAVLTVASSIVFGAVPDTELPGNPVDQKDQINPIPQIKSSTPVLQPFGSNLFTGNFLKTREDGLNPNYRVAPGDQVSVKAWGSVNISDVFTVDSQGNIFLPEIGPVRLEGVSNANLSQVVRANIQKIYINNFDVYTNIVTTQPVVVYVTGLVVNPGRYAGVPSDSLLYFLDLAGGIDQQLGSYRNIEIRRKNKVIAKVDLYDFILKGNIAAPQLQDGDTILVGKRGPSVELNGVVARPSLIEMKFKSFAGKNVLDIVPTMARGTEVTLEGMRDGEPVNSTYSLNAFKTVKLRDGDTITVRDDGNADTILIKLEGEYDGTSVLSVRRGSKLLDVLNYIPVNDNLADTSAIHIRRVSVANAQRDSINDTLFRLERDALLALSDSVGEVDIRVKEAELTRQFVERARLIDPLGRVVTTKNGKQQNIVLEANDTIVIPRKTSVVRIGGAVLMSHAVMHSEGWTAEEYIRQAGGYSNRADKHQVIILRPNAEVIIAGLDAAVRPGDEILVPPKVDNKTLQNANDFLDAVFKIAVAAKVVLD